jgi:glyoxylase-like metal-dependent hydrolase (beta-lactamase superfamily II)
MPLPIAERWFERESVDDAITLLYEPHADPLVRCNMWHVRGRERDLLVDTGLGVASLREAARDLFGHGVLAVATHYHWDHSGGLHEFDERLVHGAEAALFAEPPVFGGLRAEDFSADVLGYFDSVGYPVAEQLLTALPHADYDLAGYRVRPAPATRVVEDGDVVDIGDRVFEVLHLPGHSPGSIGLWEQRTGTLFSGDALYDGTLLAGLPDSDPDAYRRTMERLLALPVTVVHAGHSGSFGRERLRELVRGYLD